MKKFRFAAVIIALVLSLSMVSSLAAAPETSTVNQLVESPPITFLRGAEAPDGNSRWQNIVTEGIYNYEVGEVGVEVFTDKMLTGKDSMAVKLGEMYWVKDGGLKVYQVDVSIYKYTPYGNVKYIDTKTMGPNSTHTFKGLDASALYFFKFAVKQNGTTWKFSGSVS